MNKLLPWLFLFILLNVHIDAYGQCSFSDCTGSPLLNVSAPIISNGELVFDNVEIGNFTCSGAANNTSGLSIFVFELLPDGTRVSSCGTLAPSPNNYLGHVPLGFGQGVGCGSSFALFTPASPFAIGSAQGFQACDGAVYEIEVYLFLDPNGTIDNSTTPYSDILSLNADQREVVSFGPLHNTITGNFPSTGFGGPYIVNEIGGWADVQSGGATGLDFTLDCTEDIELYIRATSILNQCNPQDLSSSLPSELFNILTYSVNGGAEVDMLASAGLPDSGGVLTGLNLQLGDCYSGIQTNTYPTIIPMADINPVDGDVVTVTVSTSDVFTGQSETSSIQVSYSGPNCSGITAGCTDIDACNYDPVATIDDGSCIASDCLDGCDGMNSGPAQPGTECDDGNSSTVGDTWTLNCDCVGMSPYGGCTDASACNYNPNAVVDNGTCVPADCEGNCDGYYTGPAQPGTACDDGDPYTEYDTWTVDCYCFGQDIEFGCIDPSACNFDPNAGIDNGMCVLPDCEGNCDGYYAGPAQPGSACDDGDANTINDLWSAVCTCLGDPILSGCTDASACNFNPDANSDDGSCILIGDACDDANSETENDIINENCDCEGIATSVLPIEHYIALAPNPVEDIVTITVSDGQTISEFTLIDINGKVLKSKNEIELRQQSIDLSQYDSGCYFVRIQTDNKSYISKLIKN